jgi:hypothetical protein
VEQPLSVEHWHQAAVKSKKASGGKLPVVDVFAASEKQFNAMRLPKVAMVEVMK